MVFFTDSVGMSFLSSLNFVLHQLSSCAVLFCLSAEVSFVEFSFSITTVCVLPHLFLLYVLGSISSLRLVFILLLFVITGQASRSKGIVITFQKMSICCLDTKVCFFLPKCAKDHFLAKSCDGSRVKSRLYTKTEEKSKLTNFLVMKKAATNALTSAKLHQHLFPWGTLHSFFKQISKAGRLVFLLIAKQRRRSGSARKWQLRVGAETDFADVETPFAASFIMQKLANPPGRKPRRAFSKQFSGVITTPGVHHCKR